MTPTCVSKLSVPVLCLVLGGGLPLVAGEAAAAGPTRAERMAERIYARQAIAEARAVRAEARAAEIAKVVPEPPPPRPITVRRMARAGVPFPPPGQAQVTVAAKASPPGPSVTIQQPSPGALTRQPATVPAPKATAATPATPKVAAEPAPGVWTLDPDPAGSATVDSDGTRSVLATGGEGPPKPEVPPADSDRAAPAVTQPPIELLPTPPAE